MTEYDKLVTKMKNAPNAIRYEEIKKGIAKRRLCKNEEHK